MRIGTKLFALVSALSVLIVLVSAVSIVTLRAFKMSIDEVRATSARALDAERLNNLVTLTVMEARQTASYDGMIVDLTPTEFSLVALLTREPGKVFSREDMVEAVWRGDGRVTTQAVNANISNIRAKLRAVGAPNMIRSLRGAGYALYGA